MVEPILSPSQNDVEANFLAARGYAMVTGIPAFNEEKNIAGVILQAQKHSDLVMVCDDGSSDLTGEIAEKLGAYVIRHKRNMGYGASIRTLFQEAKMLGADVLVTLDGDSQHDPREIPLLVETLKHGRMDVVIGSRFLKGGAPKRQFGGGSA